MKYSLLLTIISSMSFWHARGQGVEANYLILTVKQESGSNHTIREYHFISSDTVVTSAMQFHDLYFSELIDYSTQNRCKKNDTLRWTDMMTIWSMSVIHDFKNLQKIVNERQAFIKTLKMGKSKLTAYVTAVSGKFCHCYMASMNGTLRLQYLPVSEFKENLNYPLLQVKLDDFELFWSDYVKSMLETK